MALSMPKPHPTSAALIVTNSRCYYSPGAPYVPHPLLLTGHHSPRSPFTPCFCQPGFEAHALSIATSNSCTLTITIHPYKQQHRLSECCTRPTPRYLRSTPCFQGSRLTPCPLPPQTATPCPLPPQTATHLRSPTTPTNDDTTYVNTIRAHASLLTNHLLFPFEACTLSIATINGCAVTYLDTSCNTYISNIES